MYSREELANGFRGLGVSPGDVVMLHASVRSVGPIAGGPDDIHLALKDVLGGDGTLVMYASCVMSMKSAAGTLQPMRNARSSRNCRCSIR